MTTSPYLRGCQGLMLALDVNTTDEAKTLLQLTAPYVAAVKIGWRLILASAEGPAVVDTVSKCTPVPILVDAKVHDAPHIAIEMIRSFKDRGARAVTIWGDVGPKVLSQCMERFPDLELFLLTGLTSSGEDHAPASVASAITTAKLCGCATLQVPGNYPSLVRTVRDELGPSGCIVACGIGAQGGEPGEAAQAGADYEIVGRDIYLAPDPASRAREYQELIMRSLRCRENSPA